MIPAIITKVAIVLVICMMPLLIFAVLASRQGGASTDFRLDYGFPVFNL